MNERLTPTTAALLLVPPLLWAGNAVVGRMVTDLISPITLNFLRWLLAFFILLPLAIGVLKPASALWPHWRRYALLGLLGVGCYNTFQYLALKTSTPLNVTLVASSAPIFMMAIGRLFFGQSISLRQVLGAVLSIAGVLLVLGRGQWQVLAQLQLVPGDVYVLIATLAWSWYSWLLASPAGAQAKPADPPEIRGNWAWFLMAQMVFGLAWSGMFTAAEWALPGAHIVWGWPLVLTLAYVAICPAILAYRCYGLGVQRVGPTLAGFFTNLTPLFAALMSAAFLGELPHAYHLMAFVLIVGGIWVSSRKGSA
jgi:drug/metabolite transporter (DMT)-like permease